MLSVKPSAFASETYLASHISANQWSKVESITVIHVATLRGRQNGCHMMPKIPLTAEGFPIYSSAKKRTLSPDWASHQKHKITGCPCAENVGNVSPSPRVSDPDMHYGTCVTRVPWCMPGSLTSSFLWSQWQGKRSRHSQRMHNPQFYVSGKRSNHWSLVVHIYCVARIMACGLFGAKALPELMITCYQLNL